jgi:chaperone modulatory protein CbpM
MSEPDSAPMRCEVVEETVQLTLVQLCEACNAESDAVVELVAHGVLDPEGDEPRAWRFTGDSLRRSRLALRLIRDLDVNVAGAALALELIDRIERLQSLLEAARADRTPAS